MTIKEKMLARLMASGLCYIENGGGEGGGGAPPPAGGGAPPPPAGGGSPPPPGGQGGGSPPPGSGQGGGAPPPENKTPPADPGEWRKRYAGDDEKRLNILNRYPSEKEFSDAFFHGRDEISRLMSDKPPGKDSTPEQLSAWRKQNGVPESAAGYFEKLPKEVVFQESDKSTIMPYLEASLARGDKPETVANNLQIYHNAQRSMMEQIGKDDTAASSSLVSSLKEDWKGEYDANMGIFSNFLESAYPKDFLALLKNARLGDDKRTPLMLHPDFVRSMVETARTLNPTGTNIGGGKGYDTPQQIDDAIAEYKNGLNGKPKIGSKSWYKDEKSQREYRGLLDLKSRQSNARRQG